MSNVLIKLSGEIDDYSIGFSRRLLGETIAGYGWNVPAGIAAISSASGTAHISVRLSGGNPGSIYRVSGYVDTSSARRLYDEFELHVGG